MRYLIVDGMLSGTGIRDAVNGGYIKREDLPISKKFSDCIKRWLCFYASAHYHDFNDEELAARLDAEGLKIMRHLKNEVAHSKISYFSSAKMCAMNEGNIADEAH